MNRLVNIFISNVSYKWDFSVCDILVLSANKIKTKPKETEKKIHINFNFRFLFIHCINL